MAPAVKNETKASKATTRISAGFGVAAMFITMALVGLAYSEMRAIKATATRITGDTMPSIYLSGQLQSVTLLRYTLLTDYVDPNNNAERAALDRQIESANAQIDEVMGEYERLIDSPRDRQLFATLKSTRAPYDECYMSILRLSRKGEIVKAQNLIGTQLIPLRDAFLKAAEAEVLWNKADADDSVDAIKKELNWTATSILICLAFGIGIVGVALVIRELLQVERKLRKSEERFRTFFEQAADSIVITDTSGKIEYVNPAFTALTGYSMREVIGRNPRILKSGRNSAALYNDLWSTISSGQVWHGEVVNRRKDGSLYDEEMRVAPVRDSKGTTTGYIAIKHDVTEQRAARDAQAFLAAIVEGSQSAIVAFRPEGTILTWNRGAEAIFGYSAEEAIGRPVSMMAPEERLSHLADLAKTVLQGKDDCHFEGMGLRKDGRVVPVLVTASPVRDRQGKVTAVAAIIRDITERRQSEQKLRESEERFRNMADSCPSLMWVTDSSGEVEFINRAYRHFCGVTHEQVEQGEWRLLIHPDDAPEHFSAFRRAVTEHATFRAEVRIRRADGQWRLIGTNAEPRFSPGGEYMGHIGLSADITERRRAEEAQRESEKRFRIMADSCPIGIWVTDADGKTAFINRVYREFIGASSSHIDASEWLARIHQDNAQQFIEHFKQAHQEHTNFMEELRCRRRDGEWRWVESYALPRLSSSGEFLGLAGINEDITERKQAELALRNSEERFRQLAENIQEVFWMMNAAGTEILYVGPAYEQIWGRSCKSLYDRPMDWMEAIHPDDRERAHETFMRQLQGEIIDSEYRIGTPDGKERWIRDRAFPVRDENGELVRIAGIAEDVTERKHAEQVLQRSEEKFRQLAENIREVFRIIPVAVDETLYVSPAYEQIWGRSMESIYGNPASWQEAVHPDDRKQADHMAVHQLLGEAVEVEYRIQTPGGQQKWIRDRAFPVRDVNGKLVRIAGIAEEITEQKRYEMELFSARQAADAANAAKSEFLANMSHEIRTPLNGVIGMNGLLLDSGLTAEQHRYAEVARASGESLLQLINDILDHSKIEAKKLELETIDFNLRGLLDNIDSIHSATARAKGIKLQCAAEPAVPTQLRGDPGRLRQILTNLVGNAIKFTEKGEVAVRAALVEEGESNCLLRFSVRDTGIGIAADKIGILFNKFSQAEFSTTRRYGGTGLGLAISKQLAELMGGDVGVSSQEGKGAEFWFTVRLMRGFGASGQSEGTEPDSRSAALPNARILIAEDNSTNREVALGMLRKLGLRANAVSNGAEAISALESIPYDLVLMDMRMPVMDGVEATRQIRSPRSGVLNCNIPVVAMTANAMDSDRQLCLAAGMNDFVAKPVSAAKLRDALRKWLPTGNALSTISAGSAVQPQTIESEPVIFDPAGVLSRLEGDSALARIVFAAFLEDLPHQMRALKDLAASGDTVSAARTAHSIKGASANVGGESLRKLAAEMEKAADAGDWRSVVARMDEMELQFSRLKDAIEADKSVGAK